MIIPLQNAVNTRDLGGIKTPHGTVACGRLIRSGKLDRLTENDVHLLQTLPLTRVLDLRTSQEMQKSPDVAIEGVEVQNISVIQATTFGISYETSDGATIARQLDAGIQRMHDRGETPIEHMSILYAGFVDIPHCRAKYGEFLRTLARNPVEGATLWHCSHGKDRVGTCTALLLWCLGASRQQIFDDYMLTNEQMHDNVNSIVNKITPFVSADILQLALSMLYVKESFLQSFFDKIDATFGGVQGFLTACDVTDEDIRLLRKNYLQ